MERGSPVARVRARVRLEPRTARNHTIPGSPRERYVALVILSLGEARVQGERFPDLRDDSRDPPV